ncbi:hypothetical protein [Amycolatopsis samaneae]|uniref:Uncharacterized protein n=1 Tax=Amycolatopsis samaneae TaxID=664691 RepID=A0ABW5GH77_9PSEU
MNVDPTRDPMAIPVTSYLKIRSGLYQGTLPAIIINDSTDELVFFAGPRWQDAAFGKEFSLHFMSAGLGFAALCGTRLSSAQNIRWPEDEGEV